jgi:hypothetical protein
VTGLDDLLRALDHHSIDKPAPFVLIRQGKLMTVTITPRKRAGAVEDRRAPTDRGHGRVSKIDENRG